MKIEDITQQQKDVLEKISSSEKSYCLLNYCLVGNINVVHYLLNKYGEDFEENQLIITTYMLSSTVKSNNLNMLKYLLNSPNLKKGINLEVLEETYNTLLFSACSSELIDMVKYINTYMKENQIKISLGNAINILEDACKVGHLPILEYIHEIVQEMNTEMNIEENNKMYQYGFIKACERGYVDIVKFLLALNTNNLLIDIHKLGDQAFISACYNNKNELLEYLIFDYHIERTLEIDELLEMPLFNEVKKMFEKREFEEKLHKGLHQENQNNNKIKI